MIYDKCIGFFNLNKFAGKKQLLRYARPNPSLPHPMPSAYIGFPFQRHSTPHSALGLSLLRTMEAKERS
jgi:hypothetical protein